MLLDMTKIVPVQSVLDVDFESLSRSGIRHVMSDIESTLCPYGVAEVDPDILAHIATAQEAGHIATFDLITNKTNPFFLDAIRGQFPDTNVWSPQSRDERKPSPHLLWAALRSHVDVDTASARPQEAAMI